MPIGVPRVGYRLPGDPAAMWVDLYNRLYRDRVLFLASDLDDELANQIVGILTYLNIENPKDRVFLYINSLGGAMTCGLSVFDVIQYVHCPVSTICVGTAASMASFVLAGGDRGNRVILPHARVMLHQPAGGSTGQSTDILMESREIQRLKVRVTELYAERTKMEVKRIASDIDRDHFYTPMEAEIFGLVDCVITSHDELPERV
jgi:ATP-dependent Clp protease protease subunit